MLHLVCFGYPKKTSQLLGEFHMLENLRVCHAIMQTAAALRLGSSALLCLLCWHGTCKSINHTLLISLTNLRDNLLLSQKPQSSTRHFSRPMQMSASLEVAVESSFTKAQAAETWQSSCVFKPTCDLCSAGLYRHAYLILSQTCF